MQYVYNFLLKICPSLEGQIFHQHRAAQSAVGGDVGVESAVDEAQTAQVVTDSTAPDHHGAVPGENKGKDCSTTHGA